MMARHELDEDTVKATARLVDRCGASHLDFGYDETTTPVTWWAAAYFQGTRVVVEHYPDAVDALEGLARRMLKDATCKCGKVVALSGLDPRRCRWTRHGDRWVSGCADRPIRVEGGRGDIAAMRRALGDTHPQAVVDLEARERDGR